MSVHIIIKLQKTLRHTLERAEEEQQETDLL